MGKMNNGKEKHSAEDLRIIRQANLLLGQLNSSNTIGCVEDINAAAFVTLFEGLCGEQLEGIVRSPATKEDEIQNIQIVIDTLASEVLHTSLAHISGRDVIESSREAVLNLLEIFSGLMEYILNKIESDASTDGEREDLDDDPDAVQPDVIDRILERELQRDMTGEFTPENTPKADRTKNSVYWEDGNGSPKKRPGERDASKAISNESSTGIRETTASTDRGDSTNDLILEGEELENKLRLNERTPVKSSQQIREEIARHRRELGLDKDPFADLVPVTTSEKLDAYKSTSKPTTKDQPSSAPTNIPRSESYNSLKNMVEETAAMARAAVDCSPNRANTILQSLENEYNRGRVSRTHKSPKTSPTRKSRSPARKQYDEQFSDSELTPSLAKRKVSFLVDRSTTDSSPSFLRTSPRMKPKVKTAWEERTRSPTKSAYTRPIQDNTKSHKGRNYYNSYLDTGSDIENLSYDDYLKKQFHEIIDDVLSDDEVLPQRYKSRSDQRRVRTEKFEKKNKGTYNVVDTKKLLEKERNSNKEKVDFLEKIYQEDLDELVNEAEYDLNRERKSAKELESHYKKKVLTGPKKVSTVKNSGALRKKMSTQKPVISSKARKKTTEGLVPSAKSKMTIKDDEDILPMLLKEFPHLHLSLHTWHELWRKGIHQIEQVSRANQEVRRKKSKAKAELEEAEKRHEIMVNIMKKELEHGQRMKEIKERQKQTVVAKNMIQEKRSQSARSRKYYDEYQVRLRSKMLKRRTREEMIFKKLFKDGLDIQKDRVRELRKYAKEQRDNQAKSQRTEIESMENYYHDQFEMLAESITKERQEISTREKAQQKVLTQMKKDIRKKMETEIKNLQDQLVRDDDDAYFRQLDADRVIHDLQLAKYHVNV